MQWLKEKAKKTTNDPQYNIQTAHIEQHEHWGMNSAIVCYWTD